MTIKEKTYVLLLYIAELVSKNRWQIIELYPITFRKYMNDLDMEYIINQLQKEEGVLEVITHPLHGLVIKEVHQKYRVRIMNNFDEYMAKNTQNSTFKSLVDQINLGSNDGSKIRFPEAFRWVDNHTFLASKPINFTSPKSKRKTVFETLARANGNWVKSKELIDAMGVSYNNLTATVSQLNTQLLKGSGLRIETRKRKEPSALRLIVEDKVELAKA